MQLAGKAAIVTGGGTGVGRATALELAAQGCAVLVNYSKSRDEAEQTAGEIEKAGAKAVAVQANVADDDACRRMVDTAVKAFGRVDVLVNNAGTTKFVAADMLDEIEDEDWQRIYAVNVIGPFHCIRAVKEPMLAGGGGQIINVSSVAAFAAKGSSIPYCGLESRLEQLDGGTGARARAEDSRQRRGAGIHHRPLVGAGTGRGLRDGQAGRGSDVPA